MMAAHDWDFIIWQRANDLLQQAERIQRNFLQVAAGARYQHISEKPSWEPPVNVVETDESVWVISAVPGVAVDRVEVRLRGTRTRHHRRADRCQNAAHDGELKIWEIPLGRFERRLRLVGKARSRYR